MSHITSSTLPQHQPLPISWVEGLFTQMSYAYGKHFADMWAGLNGKQVEEMKGYWAMKLGTLSDEELLRGYSTLDTRAWPPTLPEFIALCRPYLDPVVAYHEACQQGPRRERGEEDRWSHPAIYWAWVSVGAHALTHLPFEQLRARWSEALTRYANDPALPPVPARAIALPAPGATRLQPQRARELLAQLKVRRVHAGPVGDGRQWAKAVIEKAESGVPVSIAAFEMAEQALGLR